MTTRGAHVDITAGNDITASSSGEVNTVGDMNGEDGGNSTWLAGRNIISDDITTSGAAGTVTGGNAGTITLDASVSVANSSVRLNGDLTARGGVGPTQGNGSALTIDDRVLVGTDVDGAEPATIMDDIEVSTSGNTAGNISFLNTVDGLAADSNDLTLRAEGAATAGNVTFSSALGATAAIRDLSIDHANDVNFMSTVNLAGLNQLAGTGTTTFANNVSAVPLAVNTIHLFDGAAAVDSGTDQITLTAHGFLTGDTVIYENGAGDADVGTVAVPGAATFTPAGGTTIEDVRTIDGLQPGTAYVVIVDDANTIRLAVDQEAAETGTAIDMTAGVGANHSLAKSSVSVRTDEIDVLMNITAEDGAVDTTAGTGETITLAADTIDILGEVRTATVAPTASAVYTPTGDRLRVDAETLLTFAMGSRLVTDGGIATNFEPDLPINRMHTEIQNNLTELAYRFELPLGEMGEVNLQLHIDWRDPSNDVVQTPPPLGVFDNTPTSDRYETLTIDTGGGADRIIGHVYNIINDVVPFTQLGLNIILADFSLSHHDSIRVASPNVIDNLSLTDIQSSSDNPDTGSFNPLAQSNLPPAAANFTLTGSLDQATDNLDLHFEDGTFKVTFVEPLLVIPTPAPAPPEPLPAPAEALPAEDPPPLFVAAAELVEFPLTSWSTQSEDFFQLRKAGSSEPEPGYDHVPDEIGWKLLQPMRLRQWVRENQLDPSEGYELWLITKKAKGGEDVTFERPVLKFDVFRNEPFPMQEPMLDEVPELRLEKMTDAEIQQLLDPPETEASDAQPELPPDESTDESDETTSQMMDSGSAVGSAIAALTVSGLKRKDKPEASSTRVPVISRILNRTKARNTRSQ